MLTVVGLGNPERKYRYTRHNIGALFVEYMGGAPSNSQKSLFNSVIKDNIRLVSLNTYMNNSGKGVLSLLSKFNVKKTDLLVVHDDLDLELGVIKIKQSGSDGGHNGIKSIISNIGKDFARIRIGIGRPQNADVVSYVLGFIPQEEYTKYLEDIFPRIEKFVGYVRDKGLEKALGMASILKGIK